MEVSLVEVRPGKVRLAEVRAAEVRPAEISLAEVRPIGHSASQSERVFLPLMYGPAAVRK